MSGKNEFKFCLSESEAVRLKQEHRDVILPFVEKFRYWRMNGRKHPVYDFLFSYYSFSTGQLLRWSPGINTKIILDGTTTEVTNYNLIEWPDHSKIIENFGFIDGNLFPDRRRDFLEWATRYLRGTLTRTPVFHCFGMHEWAMVYKTDVKQHPKTPLRVTPRQIVDFVESRQMCCTHYDAFRFFSPESRPLNKMQLVREQVIENDQAGCIHANMDLYKFGYKIAPFISSNLLSKLFVLAKNARLIDMMASPYDLSEYDVSPIKMETPEGIERYVAEQKKIHLESISLREELLGVFDELLLSKESSDSALRN